MAEAGVAENVAERVLGHALPGVRGVYNAMTSPTRKRTRCSASRPRSRPSSTHRAATWCRLPAENSEGLQTIVTIVTIAVDLLLNQHFFADGGDDG
jgi:hypothetical protein